MLNIHDGNVQRWFPIILFVLCLSINVRASAPSNYVETDLVSDQTNIAPVTDVLLKNSWGIAFSPTGIAWISDNATGVSTLYDTSGNPFPTGSPLVVMIPTPPGSASDAVAAPTGVIFNASSDFVVSSGGISGAAKFIFATEDGTLSGWSSGVDATHAILAVDNSASGAVYKALTIGSIGAQNFLYATNFRAGTVDVFNAQFQPALSRTFQDPKIPKGFAPFGISNIAGQIFVTYAKQDAAKHDDVSGKGNGFIDIFDTSGTLIRQFSKKGKLNSPWGLVLAGPNFGNFSNDLLVGNFGDGTINAFDSKGRSKGQLTSGTRKRNPIMIDGLWSLANNPAGDRNTVIFTAGPNKEMNGLFGTIKFSP